MRRWRVPVGANRAKHEPAWGGNCRFESRSNVERNNAHFVRNPTTGEILFIAFLASVSCGFRPRTAQKTIAVRPFFSELRFFRYEPLWLSELCSALCSTVLIQLPQNTKRIVLPSCRSRHHVRFLPVGAIRLVYIGKLLRRSANDTRPYLTAPLSEVQYMAISVVRGVGWHDSQLAELARPATPHFGDRYIDKFKQESES